MTETPETQPTSRRNLLAISAVVAAVILVTGAVAAYFLLGDDDSDDPTRTLESLDLAEPLDLGNGDSTELRLIVDRAASGSNVISLTFGNNLEGASHVNPGFDSATVTATRIDTEGESQTVELAENAVGGFGPDELTLDNNGWWRVDVTLGMPSGETATVPYYLLIPDPNVNGFDSVPEEDTTDLGQQFYERGLQMMTSRSSMGYTQRLGGGQGTVAVGDRLVSDGSDGNPPVIWVGSDRVELLTIGDTTWQRVSGEEWIERTAIEIFPPSEWARLYEGATDFAAGLPDVVRGRPTQIITFHIPATEQQVAAWYVWWIDVETGDVLREVMTSRLHYMVYEFHSFDEPVLIESPADSAPSAASPEATPVATPVT